MPSMTSTRGSLRRRQSICPCPTSSAMTCRAPRCRSTSVKPPVDAPMSRQSRACTGMAKMSSACASFSPPRPTYGWSGETSETTMSGGTNVPGLSDVLDPACTCPAMISARARSRDGASPRSTSSVSRRTFFIEEREGSRNAQCTMNSDLRRTEAARAVGAVHRSIVHCAFLPSPFSSTSAPPTPRCRAGSPTGRARARGRRRRG